MCILGATLENQLAHAYNETLALPEVESQNRVEDLVRFDLNISDRHDDGDCLMRVE